MFKFFGEALKITNNNIILATPLILFMLIISIYKSVIGSVGNSYIMLFGFVTYILMWTAFLSGWFYIIRQAILIHYENIPKEEQVKKSFSLIPLMLKGVGEYFVSYLILISTSAVLFILFIWIVYFIGINLIGNINIQYSDLTALSTAQTSAVEQFVRDIPRDEVLKLLKWGYISLFGVISYVYITLFWAPAILKNTKNIFKAFFVSNKFLWKNFSITILFYICLCILYLILMFGCSILLTNNILSYFALLLYFYFLVYIVVLVFLFYEKYEEKSYSNNRTDSIRQDSICDKSCKED